MILAIDPGNVQSGYCVIGPSYKPMDFDKVNNETLASNLERMFYGFGIDEVVIEMIGHYGTAMAPGKTVFDTCVWIGRFIQITEDCNLPCTLIKRKVVATHICDSPKAKDSNVTQALVDRFAPYQGNYGKGTKKEPGFFYGFAKDIWQAYALGVTYMDRPHRS